MEPPAAVGEAYPWARVVRTERRLGYAEANNLGFRHACGRYLVVLNPDTRVDRDFVRALVERSRTAGDRALVTSRVCLFDDPATINTCGNLVHFGLLGACRGLGEPAARYARADEVISISGCAFLIPRSVLEDIGPFDTAIYPYLEDTELSLRAWLSGYACLTAPDSLVYHKYQLRLSPRKFHFIERNRLLVMLRIYRFPTLLLLLPALAVIELLAWGYAVRQGRGYLLAKARSYVAVGRLFPTVLRGRRRLRRLRRVGDRAILARMEARLPINQLVEQVTPARGAIKIVNAGLVGYFWLVRRIVRW